MSRLDDISKRLDARMAEIDRRIKGIVGGGEPERGGGNCRSAGGVMRSAVAPLNPEFIRWASGSRRSAGPFFGLVPEPFDFAYLRRCAPGAARRAPKAFPPQYDLRTQRALMPVRNQGSYGTCWAHAALASLESCVLRNGGEVMDLSENNLANLSGFDSGYGDGGNGNMACAYLLRWDGPVLESEDPYGRPGASRAFPPTYHLQSVRWVPPMRDASDTAGLKEAVSELGAVYVGYMHDQEPAVFNEETAAYYLAGQASPQSGGHAVAIVGWDDAFPREKFRVTPPGDGAWIVRNSWGTGWGDGGYFYVSYHDQTFGRMTPGYVFCGVESKANYDDVLQYDRLGLVSCIGLSESASAANVFPADRDLSVQAVGFYALAPQTSYRVSVRVGCSAENPVSGDEVCAVTGVCEWPGYVTVSLPSAVGVSRGQLFSTVVELTSPGMTTPVGIEFAFPQLGTSKAEAAPGQSFCRVDESGWMDMTQLDKTANFCCKAYVRYGEAGAERSHKKFCKKCGEYTWVESWSEAARCRNCGAWL